MRPSPLSRGLIAGLLLGFVLAYLILEQPRSSTSGGDAEVEKLRHQLESVRRERDGLERNLADFQEVAERMTAAFGTLEERFRSLEERLREATDDAGAKPATTPDSYDSIDREPK